MSDHDMITALFLVNILQTFWILFILLDTTKLSGKGKPL